MARTASTTRPSVPLSPYSLTLAAFPTFGYFQTASPLFEGYISNAFSLGLRVNPTSYTGGQLFSQFITDSTSRGVAAFLDTTGRVYIGLVSDLAGSDLIYVASYATVPLNKTSSILVSYDGSGVAAGVKIYVNGYSGGIQVINDTLAGDFDNNEPAFFGVDPDTGGEFRGKFYPPAVSSVALTASQALNWHFTNTMPSTTHSYPMTAGSGTTLIDTVGGVNATIVNPAWTTETGRAVASTRLAIRNSYTKSWAFNGTSSRAINAGIDYSAYNKLVFDFFFNVADISALFMVLELSNNSGVRTDAFYLDWNEQTQKLFAVQTITGGYSAWASSSLVLNRYYHVQMVLDRSLPTNVASKIYINGVLSGANTTAIGTIVGNFANSSFNVGARAGSSLFLKGMIKDLRASTFTGSYSTDNALTLYQDLIPSNVTVLNHWLGEDAGTTAVDSVGGKNLTLTNITYSSNIPCKTRTAS
jgi:hypothetical protein